MWAFWILIAISTVVLVLSTVREYLRRKKLVKRNEQQRVVDDITAETV
jgi:heme exporter protein D